MIVEFVGIPASGKSTLRTQLAGLLAEANVETTGPDRASLGRRGITKARTVVRHRRVVIIAISALIYDSRSLAVRIRALRWLIATLEKYLPPSHPTGSKSVVLLDEGLIQRSVLLFFQPTRGTKDLLLSRYLRVIPYPSLIIRLSLDPDQAAPRYLQRLEVGERPRERFSRNNRPLEDVFKDVDDFLTLVIEQVSDVTFVPVVELASDGDLAADTMRAEIVPFISAALDNEPS